MLFPASLSCSVSSTGQDCSVVFIVDPSIWDNEGMYYLQPLLSPGTSIKWIWVLELYQAEHFHITFYILGSERLQKVANASSQLNDTSILERIAFSAESFSPQIKSLYSECCTESIYLQRARRKIHFFCSCNSS